MRSSSVTAGGGDPGGPGGGDGPGGPGWPAAEGRHGGESVVLVKGFFYINVELSNTRMSDRRSCNAGGMQY